jgi:hypothetical protein
MNCSSKVLVDEIEDEALEAFMNVLRVGPGIISTEPVRIHFQTPRHAPDQRKKRSIAGMKAVSCEYKTTDNAIPADRG